MLFAVVVGCLILVVVGCFMMVVVMFAVIVVLCGDNGSLCAVACRLYVVPWRAACCLRLLFAVRRLSCVVYCLVCFVGRCLLFVGC